MCVSAYETGIDWEGAKSESGRERQTDTVYAYVYVSVYMYVSIHACMHACMHRCRERHRYSVCVCV